MTRKVRWNGPWTRDGGLDERTGLICGRMMRVEVGFSACDRVFEISIWAPSDNGLGECIGQRLIGPCTRADARSYAIDFAEFVASDPQPRDDPPSGNAR